MKDVQSGEPAATTVVGIYMFDEVEVLDFAGPFEVFSTAARLHGRRHPGAPGLFEVVLVAPEVGTVRARGGLRVEVAHSLRSHPALDVVVVPGGVVRRELDRPELPRWLAEVAGRATLVASVCTGAFLMARAGLLDGRRATTHWEDLDDLHREFPAVIVETEPRWIDTGAVLTSAGISAGIDMSLHMVGRLAGEELAGLTARQMDYTWRR
jgi:transcriptional regulator GlxA family with amidase domain